MLNREPRMPLGDDAFEAHVRTRTVHPPAILYKYTTAETARIILSTGRLRRQSPLRYNDPLDSQWDPLWQLQTPEAKEYERSLIEQALIDPSSWPGDCDPEMRAAMDRERASIAPLQGVARDRAVAEFVRDAMSSSSPPEAMVRRMQDMQRRLRVLCLCETERCMLMWSHYAEEHRGVVLGFDTAAMEQGARRPFEQVQYLDGPPVLIDEKAWIGSCVFGTDRDAAMHEREWVLTKHSSWKYEREWRSVWIAEPGTPGDFEDYPFPRPALVEIIAGCRYDPSRATELQSLAHASRPDLRFARMSRHPTKFELIRTDGPLASLDTPPAPTKAPSAAAALPELQPRALRGAPKHRFKQRKRRR